MSDHETGESLLEAEPTPIPNPTTDDHAFEPPNDAATAPQPEPRAGLALVRGFPDAMRTIGRWARRPHRVLVPWLLVSLGIAIVLLLAVWAVAEVSPPGSRPSFMPALPAHDIDAHVWYLFRRNLLVLGLHAFACLAGYIVYASLTDPTLTPGRRMRAATRATATVALVFVPIATLLSMTTQAWILGAYASTAAAHSYVTVRDLLLSTAQHSVLELTAMFLPLAAWLVAVRRKRANELYAATIVSVLIAVPMIYGAAWIEAHQWHERVSALEVHLPDLEGQTIATMLRDTSDPTKATELSIGPAVGSGRSYAKEEQALSEGIFGAMESRKAVVAIRLGISWYLYELRGRPTDACRPGSATGKPKPVRLGEGGSGGDRTGLTSFVRVKQSLPDVDPLRMRTVFGPIDVGDPLDSVTSITKLGAGACSSTR